MQSCDSEGAVFSQNTFIYGDLQYLFITFGERIISLRKRFKWSQEVLTKKIGTSAPIIGRYERGEIKPSIDVVKKLADILDTTVCYLLGEANNNDIFKDLDMLKRFNDIASFTEEERKCIVWTIDAMINNVKLKNLSHAK